MPIELNCFATLAPLTPPNSGAFPITAGETVASLVDRLGIPRDEVKIVFVNGVTSDLARPLADGDRVGIFPPVGGG
ncbi:thiamine S protein [Solidesulfovibrio carbinoliphilus subsp. oakridgensis]|uniref:Thiamine S protein n=1 Tax=Solidesulfovibrio carbinoliphilus subsp. oakridgensis TaxID=694327 RepID=G7Q4C6_9BACT|nr:MoaD/ThiS family protein [Solidesulfovibrio carbinoliphilus]EHJ46994.1 thiamine S protein [Solidesulfovibrio carbinoliphilus subsp. oakridgensis]